VRAPIRRNRAAQPLSYKPMARLAVALAIAVLACADAHEHERPAPPPKRAARQRQPRPEPRVAAIGDLSILSPALRRAFDPGGGFFEPLAAPGPDDWLAQHAETPQSFDAFQTAPTHVPTGRRRILYLQPIGEFPPDAPKLDALARLVHAFFTLEVRVLPAVRVADVPARSRVSAATKKRQLLASEVLAWLAQRVPDDAFGVEAVTMEDLYPQEAWNFVWGLASLEDRVGVQSFARLDPAFFGGKRDVDWKPLALRRAAWTMIHEITHMFGITHCTYWSCEINGSNHQAEADARPLHPCPVDLRKLYFAIGFDPAAREEALARVLRDLGIADEADWSERRARWIRTGAT
jgi:archaemetzincin